MNDVSVTVDGLTKSYRLYRRPHHRILQSVSDRLGRTKAYYFQVDAVNDVSFKVDVGETIVILGRNGSGKSTLLQMIAGTLTPTAGTITTSGKVSALLELGSGFNPDYTGRENLRLNARIFGLSSREIAATEPAIEAFADIGDFIDEPVRTYSSGMYVRLAFATAIHVIPDVFIVDEALAVGDIFFQQKCIDYILTRMDAATKLIVTHDVATAARLANRVLVMDKGRLIFDGSPLQGIEEFTNLNLRERAVMPSADTAGAINVVAEVSTAGTNGPVPGTGSVVEIGDEGSSNPEVLVFEDVALGVLDPDGGTTTWLPRPALTAGQTLTAVSNVTLKSSLQNPVFGYLIRDRVGNVIFGQNTVGSGLSLGPMLPGRYRLQLEIPWPELAEGEYVLTLGAGDGKHPLHHVIVCWAQNVTSIVNHPPRPIHGVFNSDIASALVTERG